MGSTRGSKGRPPLQRSKRRTSRCWSRAAKNAASAAVRCWCTSAVQAARASSGSAPTRAPCSSATAAATAALVLGGAPASSEEAPAAAAGLLLPRSPRLPVPSVVSSLPAGLGAGTSNPRAAAAASTSIPRSSGVRQRACRLKWERRAAGEEAPRVGSEKEVSVRGSAGELPPLSQRLCPADTTKPEKRGGKMVRGSGDSAAQRGQSPACVEDASLSRLPSHRLTQASKLPLPCLGCSDTS